MRLTDGISDALKISQKLHRDVLELQRTIDELEFLVCEIDERCKLGFFERGEYDKGRSKEGVKAD